MLAGTNPGGAAAAAPPRSWSASMEQIIFIICMFLGVAAVALIAFTLLLIVLGRITV